MKYVMEDPWKIIEDGYHPEDNRLYESLMSLGNGHMGHRGNFEEDFSGDSFKARTLQGFTTQIKQELAGGKTDTQNILPRF